MVRVKICGITSPEDAVAAAGAGADALGLNFVGGPRQIELDRAREVLAALPPLVTPVALVKVGMQGVADALIELLGEQWVSHLQVYGALTPLALTQLVMEGFRPLAVLPVKDSDFARNRPAWLDPGSGGRPSGVVLDTYDPEQQGGTGKTFHWDWVQQARQEGQLEGWPPIMLAGGLRPENVAEAVRVAKPDAVDVSSGVEVPGSPGRKDAERMRAFVLAVREGEESS